MDCPYPQGCHHYENARAPASSAHEVYDNGYCQPTPPARQGSTIRAESWKPELRYQRQHASWRVLVACMGFFTSLKNPLDRLHTLLICFLHRKPMVMYPSFQLKEMNNEAICQTLNKRFIILLLLSLWIPRYGCFFTAALRHTRQLFKDKTCQGQNSVPAASAV